MNDLTEQKKTKQKRLSLPLGNNGVADKRIQLWKQAALKEMRQDPKLFLAWCRSVLDAEANRILKPK